jgi:hypothetical protein
MRSLGCAWNLCLIEECGFLGCNSVYFGDRQTFRSNKSPPSGPKSKSRNQQKQKQEVTSRS